MLDLPVNLFDCLLLGVLIAGIIRGRKGELSKQLIALVKWLTILLGCAAAYNPLAGLIAQTGFFDPVSSCVMAYLGLALLILLIFSFVQRKAEGKFSDTDVSNSYTGMASGLVRFTAMLLIALALLNARTYTPAQIKASEKFQVDMFGSNLFPTPHTVQSWAFEKSLSGPWIKQGLGFLLINPPVADEPAPQWHANSR
jgi:hypothetical protein